MKRIEFPRPRPAAAAIACALALVSGAFAQTREADEKALQAAQAELEQAARRVSELSRRLGVPERAPLVIERRVARKPVLGVVLAPDAQRGVLVGGVTPGSGAQQAGLRSGDRIVALDGKAVSGADEQARLEQARTALADLDPKRPVTVEYERDGKRATAKVTPRIGERAFVVPDARGMRLGGAVRILEGEQGRMEIEADSVTVAGAADGVRERRIIRHDIRGTDTGDIEEFELASAPGVVPGVHREIIRLGPGGGCRGDACEMPLIAEAMRWNGLNLASVDGQLGRYFGTDRGVLVLSTPTSLGELQAGDVIRTIDGKPVATPREAMTLLRARPADSTATIGYLRDRREASARIRVPKASPLRMPPAPPPPPAPPVPPAPPPSTAPVAPSAPPAPPPPPPPVGLASVQVN